LELRHASPLRSKRVHHGPLPAAEVRGGTSARQSGNLLNQNGPVVADGALNEWFGSRKSLGRHQHLKDPNQVSCVIVI
jgi:hypothetical protein